MFNRIARGVRLIYNQSPRSNLKLLASKLSRTGEQQPKERGGDRYQVLEPLVQTKSMPALLAYQIRALGCPEMILLGDKAVLDSWDLSSRCGETAITCLAWDWSTPPQDVPTGKDKALLVCRLPATTDQWEALDSLRKAHKGRFLTLIELLLPFTQITWLWDSQGYFMQSFDEQISYYLGDAFWGALDALDKEFPLKGRKILEFGPFEGTQTAGLVHLGAGSVDCIEAHAENVIKTSAAVSAFGWKNVRLIMDDFHSANAARYGRYDLAFAHGVYYHSVAPFIFLENLMTLSDNIFIGGFCATDTLPGGDYSELSYQGETFRVKRYREKNTSRAGVNTFAYFFVGEDLVRFFSDRGYRITVISDEIRDVTAGRYLRFLARK